MIYPIWNQFADSSLLVQVLSLLQLAFTIWMMVDAYKRRVESFWYWIIFIMQPVGAWVYFFAVKFRTFRFSKCNGMPPQRNGACRLMSCVLASVEHRRSPIGLPLPRS